MFRLLTMVLLLSSLFILSPVFADSHLTDRKDVQEFINKMVSHYHFKQDELIALFNAVKIHPQVIRHINKPLESQPWDDYQMVFVNEWRIQHGVEFWKKNEVALKRAEEKYGVPASIIVATLGIETKYGQRMGDFRVIDSLCNLAFSDTPRASFFRTELQEFLLLTREQHLDPLKVMGSYAGAIGQPQFMPSSYRYYAVDFSNNGKIDLINNETDAIGSIANYYSKHGWVKNAPVAVPAVMIGSRYSYLMHRNKIHQPFTLSELPYYGIVPKIKIEHNNLRVKVIALQNRYNKEYWLGFENFDVIKRYNVSDLYAMAVYQLSIYISELKERLNNV